MNQHTTQATPSKDDIALLAPFDRLDLDRITLVSNADQAHQARQALSASPIWGFDTESKPTFVKDEVSTGPHTVQLGVPLFLVRFRTFQNPLSMRVSRGRSLATRMDA